MTEPGHEVADRKDTASAGPKTAIERNSNPGCFRCLNIALPALLCSGLKNPWEP